jgi:hypothetical protein
MRISAALNKLESQSGSPAHLLAHLPPHAAAHGHPDAVVGAQQQPRVRQRRCMAPAMRLTLVVRSGTPSTSRSSNPVTGTFVELQEFVCRLKLHVPDYNSHPTILD